MMGLYEIRNMATGQVYVGSSLAIQKRFNQHKSELRKGVHENKNLQESWNSWGEDQFKFDVVAETSDASMIRSMEQERLDSLSSDSSYNVMLVACRPPTARGSVL